MPKPSQSDPAQYTQPTLRDSLKKKITAAAKGGSPGQWSARKAQLLAHQYEAQGGSYKNSRTPAQKSLKQWGDEKWKTSDGAKAQRKGGTTRYLPAKAWDKLSDSQKAATNNKKQSGSKAGKQFIANTPAAASAAKKTRTSESKSTTAKKPAAKKPAAKKPAAMKKPATQ